MKQKILLPRPRSRFFISLAALSAGAASLWVSLAVLPLKIGALDYTPRAALSGAVGDNSSDGEVSIMVLPAPVIPQHLPPPEPLYGIYMSSWVAATPSLREELMDFMNKSEVNALVMDIKDYSGRIAFATDHPTLVASGASDNRIRDIRALVERLHMQGIYVIGRVSVFQDPYLAAARPDLAVKRESNGAVWKDRKGMTWVDPASREVWEYTVAIAEEAERLGFDELNFDYIRFPSDGNMNDIAYPFFDKLNISKQENMRQFFVYLDEELEHLKIPISADLFGLTTSATDDLGIGQKLEDALVSFDYVAPMIYPSHYPDTFLGYQNPAEHPYEIIKFALDEGVKKAQSLGVSPLKLRPWLQDFDLGANYTAEMVRAQKQATYDAGLTSWLMWDPSNKYTRAAFDKTPD